MTTVKKFADNLKSIEKQLKKVGIKASTYIDNCAGIDNPEFLIGLDRTRQELEFNLSYEAPLLCEARNEYDNYGNTIKYQAKLEVLGTSKKYQQAVLRLREPARTVVRKVSIFSPSEGKRGLTKKEREKIEKKATHPNVFPVSLPEGTKYSSKFIGSDLNRRGSEHRYICEVTATLPKSDQHFLVGFDEEYMFISLLPKAAKTVEQAHSVLMPPEVKRAKGVLRQGEFYLVPLNKTEEKALDKMLRKDSTYIDYFHSVKTINGDFSDHTAAIIANVIYKNKQIQVVSGFMRNERHYLRLNGWYKVVQNLEIPSTNDEALWD